MDLDTLAARLWAEGIGSHTKPTLTPCPVSGNNRVYLAEAEGRQAILKWYFRGAPGSRDRMGSEWAMLEYGRLADIAQMPRPLACEREAGLGLQECVSGRKPVQADIGPALVDAAAGFFADLNDPAKRPHAQSLPIAQEACFSTETHLAMVDHRLERLRFTPSGDLDLQAAGLIARMNILWAELKPRIRQELAALGIAANTEQPPWQRCVSPADFGFHNAMIRDDGLVKFFDFEYGGWDDPAKTICDFFLVPALPVDMTYWKRFAKTAFAPWGDYGAEILARASIMKPLFAIKWCCIMLNPFAPVLASPGQFANPGAALEERKALQLPKAEQAFAALMTEAAF